MAAKKRKRNTGALERTDSPVDETLVEVCPTSLDETPSVHPLSLVESSVPLKVSVEEPSSQLYKATVIPPVPLFQPSFSIDDSSCLVRPPAPTFGGEFMYQPTSHSMVNLGFVPSFKQSNVLGSLLVCQQQIFRTSAPKLCLGQPQAYGGRPLFLPAPASIVTDAHPGSCLPLSSPETVVESLVVVTNYANASCLVKYPSPSVPVMPSVVAPALLDFLLDYSSPSVQLLTVMPSVVAPALVDFLLGNAVQFLPASVVPPALSPCGYHVLRELLLCFKRRRVSFDLLRVLRGVCYALTASHVEGLLPELSKLFDTSQLCLHLSHTLCFWVSTAAVLPPLHSVCPSSMRAGATSLTKLLVMPSCGGIVFFGRPTSFFVAVKLGCPLQRESMGRAISFEDAHFAGGSISSVLLISGLHRGAEYLHVFLVF